MRALLNGTGFLISVLLLFWLAPLALADMNAPQSTIVTKTIQVQGKTRSFLYTISEEPAPATGRPLVILLHGDGGTMSIPASWRDTITNDNNGAVIVAPQGRNNIGEAVAIDGSAWRFRMDEAGRPYDDIDFIQTIIDQSLGNNLLGTTIDPARVYLVGFSRGAGFAYFLYADPRTANKISAIVPISGTFYCEGDATNPGVPGSPPLANSDLICGEVSIYGWWGPKSQHFSPPAVTRPVHILDVHGQIASGEFAHTAPPKLDVSWESSTWVPWGDAAGCYTELVSSQTEQVLPFTVGGKTVKTYAYSQSAGQLATRCANLDLTFYIVQGGGHVPGGFEQVAWCYLSTVGGNPSAAACANTTPTPSTPTTPVTTPTSQTTTPTPPTSDHRVNLPFVHK